MKFRSIFFPIFLLSSANSIAANSVEDLKPHLQKILQCDPTVFPKTKKQTAEFSSLKEKLNKSGIKATTSGAGTEIKVTYKFPKGISVFGREITIIDDLQPPFVSIKFSIPAADLIKAIEATNSIKFKTGQEKNIFEQVISYKSKVEGEKYPIEHDITIIANSKNQSTYICNYRSTDPEVGG